LQQPQVIERLPDELDPDWQVVLRVPCGHHDTREASGGNKAAAEFQKIFDNRGIVLNESIGALAHL
jgi:hypothetical protein